jgi:hypothetical protein
MKILMASTPATGHLNPLLAIGRVLIAEGHELVFLSGSVLRGRIEAIGAKFHALPKGADYDLRDFDEIAPELKAISPGLDWLRVALERVFVDTLPFQYQGAAGSAGFSRRRRHRRRHVVRGGADAARTALEAAPHRALRHLVPALAA